MSDNTLIRKDQLPDNGRIINEALMFADAKIIGKDIAGFRLLTYRSEYVHGMPVVFNQDLIPDGDFPDTPFNENTWLCFEETGNVYGRIALDEYRNFNGDYVLAPYFCNNEISGSSARDLLGFKSSWGIGNHEHPSSWGDALVQDSSWEVGRIWEVVYKDAAPEAPPVSRSWVPTVGEKEKEKEK